MSDAGVIVRGGRRRRFSLPRWGSVVTKLSLAVVAVAILLAVFGPALAPHDPTATNLNDAFVGPVAGHPLGFDEQGRDLLSEVMAGSRPSLLGPAAVVLMSMIVGILLSLVASWRGGWVDSVVSTALDILFAFPGILLAVLAAAVFGPSLTAATLALAAAYSPYVARVLRGALARERSQEYIAAVEVQGLPALTIWIRHLLPNVRPLVIAQATLLFAYAFVDLATISFLGLGVQAPELDWGTMVSAGKSAVLQGYPAETLIAGACIIVVVVAVNLLGEQLAEKGRQG